ncbi:MAG: UTP--glucose-phosphate uridylyltransferase [Solirubrobacteraceae bacterium]|nr:UTP--glucose-phosphate uridylyltransferase [Solirubrobacteraceae bacterium]
MSGEGLEACIQKMRDAEVAGVAIDTFADLYRRLAAGETGLIAEAEIEPVETVPDADELPDAETSELLDQAVVIKLNGGLGTSMGMTRAKSLLEAREGETFLDLIARQVFALRERSGARVPLVLMNSFATREDSLAALDRHSGLSADLPPDFLQSKEPKVLVEDLMPASWPPNPALEWCPPGHGDLFVALQTSGVLAAMLDGGYRWAFVSNSDNLGAVLDPRILAWIAREQAPFVMEVADRTAADRKGGHIARRRGEDGLVLREIAQTPEADLEAFQDTSRHRFFNTNTIWFDLRVVADELERRGGVLGLPLIRNRKTLDPSDPASPEVFQIETAMGAALGVIGGAQALRVPRDRFAPVKTTNDLLALRSDAYEVAGDGRIVLVAQRDGSPPQVDLDPEFFKLVGDFEPRVAAGAPSLRDCERLVVRGDVTFGADVVVRGDVEIEAHGGPVHLADGTVLEG